MSCKQLLIACIITLVGATSPGIAGEMSLPEAGKVYVLLVNQRPLFIGDWSCSPKAETPGQYRVKINVEPEQALLAQVSSTYQGRGIMIEWWSVSETEPTSAGYMLFGELSRHPQLGLGYAADAYQTYEMNEDGLLNPKEELSSIPIFLALPPRLEQDPDTDR